MAQIDIYKDVEVWEENPFDAITFKQGDNAILHIRMVNKGVPIEREGMDFPMFNIKLPNGERYSYASSSSGDYIEFSMQWHGATEHVYGICNCSVSYYISDSYYYHSQKYLTSTTFYLNIQQPESTT